MANLENLKNISILVADDDEVTRYNVLKILNIFCRNTFEASDGVEAYNLYETKCPDLIIADITMPKLNGLDLVRKIRNIDNITPIILLSSISDSQTLLKAVNLNINGYIVKPYKYEDLIEACRKAVSQRFAHTTLPKITTFDVNSFYSAEMKTMYINGQPIDLGEKERKLLEFFILQQNNIVTKENISSFLYNLEYVTDSAIKNLIIRLRKKIGEHYIVYVKGAGWRLKINQKQI